MVRIHVEIDRIGPRRAAGSGLDNGGDVLGVLERFLEAERDAGEDDTARGAPAPARRLRDRFVGKPWLLRKLSRFHASHRTHWNMASRESYWPLFGLRVRTPRVELRYPDDDDVVALAELAGRGIHDPDVMPFEITWTDVPSPELEQNSLKHYWLQRATWMPDDWKLPLAVVVDGEVVGTQAVHATQFAKRRVADTGSWLGRAHQGRGIGKEMRAAILHLIFAGLDADLAESGAWHDNAPSLGVSRSLGYEKNGEDVKMRRDVADRQVRLRLTRASWEERRRSDIEIEGLDPCRSMFGLG